MKKRLLALASLAAAGVLVLSGCSAPGSPQPDHTAGESSAPTETPDLGVAWLAGGTAIALQTFGSGSRDCYPQVGEVAVNGSDVTVQLNPLPAEQICTMDYRPQLSFVALGSQPDTKKDVTVKVEFTETGTTFTAGVLPAIEVAADASVEGPSAGWINQNAIALLTYGSGSVDCWPTVKSVSAPDAAQGVLTVELAESTHTGPCTADYRPQVHEVFVDDGLVDPALINALVLNGAGFTNEQLVLEPAKF